MDGVFVGTTPLLVFMATNQTYHVRAEKDGYLAAETNSEPIKHWDPSATPLGERVAIAIVLAPLGGGFLTSVDNAKFTRHQPVEFVLLPLVKTNQDGGK